MTKITLVCASGMSTSMLMAKMKERARQQGIDVSIVAMSESNFTSSGEMTDILLLGPQVSYLVDKLKADNEPKGIKVAVINMVDYGMMKGEKVLKDALDLLA